MNQIRGLLRSFNKIRI